MKIIYLIFSFLLGADFEILRLCPTDFTKQLRRIFIALIVTAFSYVSATFAFNNKISIGIATIILLLYILFLCKSSEASFLKFVTTLAIATFIFWGISRPAFGGINYLNINDIESLVIASIIGIIDLILCYMPVNFSNASACYDKLLKQTIENKEASARLFIEEKANADRTIIKNREATRIKLETDIYKYMSRQILKSQKEATDKIVELWIKEIEKEITSNVAKFCVYDKIQQIKINKEYEDELNNYISELLKDKREEFARIIVEKWAEEKKHELGKNPNAYIS